MHKVDIFKGYFAYECLSTAIRMNNNYTGYLFIMDDVLLNFWNLVDLDSNKIWEGPKQPIAIGQFHAPTQWYWWKSRWGKTNCQKAFNEVSSIKRDSHEAAILISGLLDNLKFNSNGKYKCHRGRSDIFYVPARLTLVFEILTSIFRKHDVFLEIAVPTIFRLLERVENIERLQGIYLPGRVGDKPVKDSRYFWSIYDESLHFVHPLKLHYAQDSTMNYAVLKHWIIKKIVLMTNCSVSAMQM